MTTLKERFEKVLPLIVEDYNNFIVEAGEIGELDIEEIFAERLLPFFRQELLALAEEIEATKQPNDPGFANTEAAKDYGKLDDLADYAETAGANTALVSAAALIRSKADELV